MSLGLQLKASTGMSAAVLGIALILTLRWRPAGLFSAYEFQLGLDRRPAGSRPPPSRSSPEGSHMPANAYRPLHGPARRLGDLVAQANQRALGRECARSGGEGADADRAGRGVGCSYWVRFRNRPDGERDPRRQRAAGPDGTHKAAVAARFAVACYEELRPTS